MIGIQYGVSSIIDAPRSDYLSALRAEPATASLLRSAASNSFKTNGFAIDFLDFVMSKCIQNECKSHSKPRKNRVLGRPGGSRGRLGDHLGPRMAQGSKMAAKNREILVPVLYQNRDSDLFFVVLFFLISHGVLLLIFVGFGCPKPRFRPPF